ncbi:MAG: hypothetical protein FJ390_03055 [Verrucomicrobia bacterium]|nr:hypothetical protein [Verrucomicrobiota bacterium]
MSKKSFFWTQGSVLLAALFFLAALSILIAFSLERVLFEKRKTSSIATSYQATLAAQSGLAAAMSQLSLATKDHPQFLVGETSQDHILFLGATNLTTQEQLMPLISGDLNVLLDFPKISQENRDHYFQIARDPQQGIDLNKKNHPIAASGSYWAPWVNITNNSGIPIARYAYRFFDEQARLNPALHQGKPRTDPDHWNQGSAVIPLFLENDFLFSQEEASALTALADQGFLENGFSSAFRNRTDFENKKNLLTRSEVALLDFIPFSMPDGGKLKYDLNDLATNRTYGLTKSERAMHLTEIIDHNLPHFKERDPSLRSCSQADQRRYINRLAACIVDYINPPSAATLVNGGEPAGQILSPLATQIAERLRLQSCSSNSVTIESQYFVQVWNPYTKPIPGGETLSFTIDNRPLLHFGTAEPTAFENYHQTIIAPAIRPNESLALAFPTVTQTWNSPTPVATTHPPYWLRGPKGNANPKRHQTFSLYWNYQLIEMSRNPPVGPGLTEGGLEHEEGSLSNSNNYWHCNFIPTEQDRAGHFRFVGDPRDNYLSNYLWKSYSGEKSYLEETRWQGVMSDVTAERQFDPSHSWSARDFIPISPPKGNHPSSITMTPDQVPSSYQEEDTMHAPLVMRHGPMNSIVELGNIHDPVQADDLGFAPEAGSSEHQTSIYASGGGRTLRIGQPEFFYWNVPGKRAIDLLDLFTLAPQNKTGLININTAPHEVLTALFYGITPTSDQRFLHSKINLKAAERLSTLLEEHRPYEKISDLDLLTPLLANAETYSPTLGSNILSGEIPLATLFDRAREEGFGKMISLCTIRSRAFRVFILGQALDRHGRCSAESMMEAIITLEPSDSEKKMTPVIREIKWL